MARPAVVLGLLPAGLALARALGRAGIPVSGIALDEHDFGIRSRYLGRRFLVREGDEEARDRAVVAALRELAVEGRLVLFPERDEHVALVLRRWDEIRELADVPLPPDPAIVHRLARKDLLPLEAEKAGVPAPTTVVAETADDVRSARLPSPFLVKPIESESYARRFGHKAVAATGRDEALRAWQAARDEGFGIVLQEYIPNSHDRVFSVFTYVGRDGQALGSVVGRKLRQGPLRLGSSTVFETRVDLRVRELGLRLLTSARYRGFAHVEFAYDRRDDAYKLLEVNVRLPVWAGIAMTPRFDLARLAYDDLCGLPTPPPRVLDDHLTWVYGAKDAAVALQMARRREFRLGSFVEPYRRRPKVRAVLAADDRRPVLGLARWMGARAAAKLSP